MRTSNSLTGKFDRKDIKECFDMFDFENQGRVHNTEILPALQSFGWAVSETDAVQIICEMDNEGHGEVDYAAFASWIIKHEEQADDPEEIVKTIFDRIDTDRSGSITASELMSVFEEMQEKIQQMDMEIDMEDAQEIVKEADRNGDGVIDLEEFGELMKSVLKQG